MSAVFPDIIDKVPVRDYGIDGLSVHVDHTSTGTVYFVSAEKEVPFPEHSHAAQWTVVVSGKCLFTANGETKTYQQGDTYFIPAGLNFPFGSHIFPYYRRNSKAMCGNKSCIQLH
ncbi:MAG: cupin domain-containing protein [Anaerovibrio sp.]|uniref:cupin domain-containing protein n=1 Tax=Anaerovibrio sp. TaxID=1872532 RepID=UPI001AFD9377|nr:cupin domain-containing protein [Anaerovibrio sp.]MBO5589187.1 cupin domain-containing protein [Anaerovibrio sp.]MBO6244971.1 cupin domain-containing protein [Anaerovibrio sp.]